MKIVPSCVDVAGIPNHVTKALEDGNVSLNMNQIIVRLLNLVNTVALYITVMMNFFIKCAIQSICVPLFLSLQFLQHWLLSSHKPSRLLHLQSLQKHLYSTFSLGETENHQHGLQTGNTVLEYRKETVCIL